MGKATAGWSRWSAAGFNPTNPFYKSLALGLGPVNACYNAIMRICPAATGAPTPRLPPLHHPHPHSHPDPKHACTHLPHVPHQRRHQGGLAARRRTHVQHAHARSQTRPRGAAATTTTTATAGLATQAPLRASVRASCRCRRRRGQRRRQHQCRNHTGQVLQHDPARGQPACRG